MFKRSDLEFVYNVNYIRMLTLHFSCDEIDLASCQAFSLIFDVVSRNGSKDSNRNHQEPDLHSMAVSQRPSK